MPLPIILIPCNPGVFNPLPLTPYLERRNPRLEPGEKNDLIRGQLLGHQPDEFLFFARISRLIDQGWPIADHLTVGDGREFSPFLSLLRREPVVFFLEIFEPLLGLCIGLTQPHLIHDLKIFLFGLLLI